MFIYILILILLQYCKCQLVNTILINNTDKIIDIENNHILIYNLIYSNNNLYIKDFLTNDTLYNFDINNNSSINSNDFNYTQYTEDYIISFIQVNEDINYDYFYYIEGIDINSNNLIFKYNITSYMRNFIDDKSYYGDMKVFKVTNKHILLNIFETTLQNNTVINEENKIYVFSNNQLINPSCANTLYSFLF